MSEETPVVRIDWRIAVGCAAALTLVFAAPSVPILGVRTPLATRLANQGLGWALWLALMPLVFGIAARARRSRIGDWRNIAFQLAASVAIPLAHEVSVATIRWFAGTTNATSYPFFV